MRPLYHYLSFPVVIDDDLSLSYVLLQGPQGPPGGVGPMGSVGEKVRIKTWRPSVLCLH